MRFLDWDIILFPGGTDHRVPFKEFRADCHLTPDPELTSVNGLPVMTCFIPAIPAGHDFQVSIHNWNTPEISKYTHDYSGFLDLVKLYARIYIDGRLVASSVLDRDLDGPRIITNTFELNKAGEYKPLTFPPFRPDLLQHKPWSPMEDLGRIKVLISEGFPRDDPSNPMQVTNNIVAFSFQHAPLFILEEKDIAWPRPSMWLRLPQLTTSTTVPTFRAEEGADSHAHSPRGKVPKTTKNFEFSSSFLSGGPANNYHGNESFLLPYGQCATTMPATSGSSYSFGDPFSETPAYPGWSSTMDPMPYGQSSDGFNWNVGNVNWPVTLYGSRKQSSDVSMPDFMSAHLQTDTPIPMHISEPSLEDDTMGLKAPTNSDFLAAQVGEPPWILSNPPRDLSNSLLNQPVTFPLQPHDIPLPSSEVKSRKENRNLAVNGANTSSSAQSTPHAGQQHGTRNFSQGIFPLGSLGPGYNTSFPADSTNSNICPSLQSAFSAGSRRTSAGDFRTGLAANPNPLLDSTTPSSSSSSSGAALSGGRGIGGSGLKRSRNFTPASAKVIDEEDEPRRRISPHVRIGGFGGDVPTKEV